jgi:hypothetical protein
MMGEKSTRRRYREGLVFAVGAAILVGGAAEKARAQIGGELGRIGGEASDLLRGGGGAVSDALKRGAAAVGDEAARLDPSVALMRELEAERSRAMGTLRWFDPETILGQIGATLSQAVDATVLRTGASFNPQTGDVDLRGTSIGRTLQAWLFRFAQGNHREAAVQEFRFNVPSRVLVVRLFVRHQQTWGKVFPGQGPVDLYSVAQTAMVRFDFNAGTGDFAIDTGPWGPRIAPGTFQRLESGDFLGVAQGLIPQGVGDLARLETSDDLDEVENSYSIRFGRGNVHFPSRGFAEFATPERLARYVVNGVISLGTDVWPEIMSDLQGQARAELPALVEWLRSRGLAEADSIAEQLISGRVPELPSISFRLLAVPFRSRNVTPVGAATPWRTVNHLTFIVIWHGPPQAERPPTGLRPAPEIFGPGLAGGESLDDERRQRTALLENQQELLRLRRAAQSLAPPGSSGPGTPAGNGGPGETFAQNLGIAYEPVRFGDGTFGVKLTRYPVPGSPGAQLGLEPGDIITALDDMPFRTPDDVLNHTKDTTVRLINVRTNAPVDARVVLP